MWGNPTLLNLLRIDNKLMNLLESQRNYNELQTIIINL